MNNDDKSSGSDNKGGFWTTLPGIITGLSGLIAAITGLIVALQGAGIIGDKENSAANPSSPSPSPTQTAPAPVVPSPQPRSPEPYIDPTKPFLVQLGSDETPTSAGDEIDRVKELALRKNLRVDQFKQGNWYVTTVGFFSSREEAANFRSLVLEEIPFFQSTSPQIQNIREWCPSPVPSGTYFECRS